MIPAYTIQQHFAGSFDAMTTLLYDRTAWLDFADFETSGAFTISGSKIVSPNDTTSYVRLANATGLEAYTLEVQAKWLANNSGTNIMGVKLDSINATSAQGATITVGGSPNNGKIVAFRQFTSATTLSTGALSPAVGDVITLKLTRYVNGYFDITATIGSTSVSLNVYLMPNAHKITFAAQGNTFSIQRIKWLAPYPSVVDRMLFGDSITVGSASTNLIYNSFASMIHAVRSAGLGDKTAEGVARLKDALWRLHPKKAFIALGTNDILNSVSAATWQANLNSMDSQLTAAGIPVVFITPIPSNSADMSVVKTWLAANKAGRFIDVYTPLLGTGTNMNAAYNSGDGIHPNDAGHLVMANTILGSSLYT